MAIAIPLNEQNWLAFYRVNTAKGVKIRSRYKGVNIKLRFGVPIFYTRYNGKVGAKWLGSYPLTQDGEREAFEAYSEYLSTLNADQISKHPGRVIKAKITPSLEG